MNKDNQPTKEEVNLLRKQLVELSNKFDNLVKQHNIVVTDLRITKANLIKVERALKQKIRNVENKIPRR